MRAPLVAELKLALGDPTPLMEQDGTVSAQWPAKILTAIPLPQAVPYAGDLTRLVSLYRVHQRLAPYFRAAFAKIALMGAWPEIHDWGGTYEWRANRNDPARLSSHAWGAAVDLNPIELPNGSTLRIDARIVSAFSEQGLIYGGDFHHPDPMHFEASAELLQKLGPAT